MADMEERYVERLDRYTTAMRNEQPDRVPISPRIAAFLAVAPSTAFCDSKETSAEFDIFRPAPFKQVLNKMFFFGIQIKLRLCTYSPRSQ